MGREVLLLVEKGWAKDRLGTLNMRQFIGQDEVLAGVMERVISVILERLWWLGKISDDSKKVNITPVFKKGKEGYQEGAVCSA